MVMQPPKMAAAKNFFMEGSNYMVCAVQQLAAYAAT
jgi:hypothetical protein